MYWQTVFVADITNPSSIRVRLSATDRIIRDSDLQRGYFRREDLLNLYGYIVTDNHISNYSYMIEYSWSGYNTVSDYSETVRLPII